jgi:hypothetical protein
MLLKLKKRDSASITKANEVLSSMRGKIEFLQDISVNTNIRLGPTSYDISVTAKYKTMDDFNSYLTHPVHVEVSKYIGGVVDAVASVCYEI